jgi:hypothetical protein
MELCDDVDSDLAAKETEGLACKGAIAALDNPGSVFAGAYSVARKGPVASRSVRQQRAVRVRGPGSVLRTLTQVRFGSALPSYLTASAARSLDIHQPTRQTGIFWGPKCAEVNSREEITFAA